MFASRPTGVALGAAALALGLCLSSATWAQQANSREQEQIRRLRQQVQQLQAAQTEQQQTVQQAQAAQAATAAGLATAEATLRNLRASEAARSKVAAAATQDTQTLLQAQVTLQASADALRSQLQVATGELAAVRASASELRTTMSSRDASLASLLQRHMAQGQGLQTCIANNQSLVVLGQEMLQRLGNRGTVETLALNEPFLRFSRVALENLLQGYQDRLDPLALQPGPAKTEGAARVP